MCGQPVLCHPDCFHRWLTAVVFSCDLLIGWRYVWGTSPLSPWLFSQMIDSCSVLMWSVDWLEICVRYQSSVTLTVFCFHPPIRSERNILDFSSIFAAIIQILELKLIGLSSQKGTLSDGLNNCPQYGIGLQWKCPYVTAPASQWGTKPPQPLWPWPTTLVFVTLTWTLVTLTLNHLFWH